MQELAAAAVIPSLQKEDTAEGVCQSARVLKGSPDVDCSGFHT